MHVVRVGRYAGILARQLGAQEEWAETLEHAAPLHDVGKIGIRDSILLKRGPLEPSEYEEMKEHCLIGTSIIRPASLRESCSRRGIEVPESPILKMACSIAETHHERWDGNGYPDGIGETEIPLGSRLMLVADTYEAMTSDRAYRKGLPHEVAIAELERCSGSQFDPECVKAFLAAHSEPPDLS